MLYNMNGNGPKVETIFYLVYSLYPLMAPILFTNACCKLKTVLWLSYLVYYWLIHLLKCYHSSSYLQGCCTGHPSTAFSFLLPIVNRYIFLNDHFSDVIPVSRMVPIVLPVEAEWTTGIANYFPMTLTQVSKRNRGHHWPPTDVLKVLMCCVCMGSSSKCT